MFLVKHQPKGYDINGNLMSNYISRPFKEVFLEGMSNEIRDFFHTNLDRKKIIQLFTDGSILDSMLVTSAYYNILFVPTYKIGDTIGDSSLVGYHFAPMVHQRNNSAGKCYIVSTPSPFSQLYESAGLEVVKINNEYFIDTKKLKLSTDIKFDAVVLIGCESVTSGKHNVSYVKNMFAPYCTEDFSLIDLYNGKNRTLQPNKKLEQKDINRIKRNANVISNPDVKTPFDNRLEYFQSVCGVY